MKRKVGVGVVGCGHVSLQYLEGFQAMSSLEVVGCFDVDRTQAETRAAEFDIPRIYRHLEELLADPAVEIVLNITPPLVHFEVSETALEAGKHVFSEKPLAPTREQGQHLLHLAAANQVRLACAPDTFLGSGLQTS
ncbi:MAG: Gfo/Idh/MocA family oxidoreductase, partial [bacterium]|nr:Gfo/Idh/MocA family oxidoreductase [bacterium]